MNLKLHTAINGYSNGLYVVYVHMYCDCELQAAMIEACGAVPRLSLYNEGEVCYMSV